MNQFRDKNSDEQKHLFNILFSLLVYKLKNNLIVYMSQVNGQSRVLQANIIPGKETPTFNIVYLIHYFQMYLEDIFKNSNVIAFCF